MVRQEYLNGIAAGLKQDDFIYRLTPVSIYENYGIQGRLRSTLKKAGISEPRLKQVEQIVEALFVR